MKDEISFRRDTIWKNQLLLQKCLCIPFCSDRFPDQEYQRFCDHVYQTVSYKHAGMNYMNGFPIIKYQLYWEDHTLNWKRHVSVKWLALKLDWPIHSNLLIMEYSQMSIKKVVQGLKIHFLMQFDLKSTGNMAKLTERLIIPINELQQRELHLWNILQGSGLYGSFQKLIWKNCA